VTRARVSFFSLMIWLLAIALAGWLCFQPLVMNFIAKRYWLLVPCNIVQEAGTDVNRYFYVLNGSSYAANRRDFWDPGHGDAIRSNNLDIPKGKSSECYVKPSTHSKSVLYIEGLTNIQHSGRSLGLAIAVLFVAAVLNWGSQKQIKRRSGR